MATKEEILNALSRVIDPEIGLSIVDLGLVYGVEIKDGDVEITMTMTVPGCPLAHIIVNSAEKAAKQVKGVKNVNIKLVWDPPWDPSMMSERAKRILGLK